VTFLLVLGSSTPGTRMTTELASYSRYPVILDI
jgi:hypothetical protein